MQPEHGPTLRVAELGETELPALADAMLPSSFGGRAMGNNHRYSLARSGAAVRRLRRPIRRGAARPWQRLLERRGELQQDSLLGGIGWTPMGSPSAVLPIGSEIAASR